MLSVDEGLQALNTAIAQRKTPERQRLAQLAGHFSSHLVLLKSSSLSPGLAQQLAECFRKQLPALYDSILDPSLRLAAALFEQIYHEKVLPALSHQSGGQQGVWECVLHALLSGVLDFLDAHESDEVKEGIGAALYPSICDICFSLTGPKTGVDLRCTAYNVLSDSAAGHQVNQTRLQNPNVLGGERLGALIWRTRDYLPLESLLNLFARALPSTNKSAAGRAKRTAYIRSVFVASAAPEAEAIGHEIANLLEHVPSSDWENTATRIVDALANGNISFPQPFVSSEILSCGQAFPLDRIYLDDKTFLANVPLNDDQYESLEISYWSVRSVELHRTADAMSQEDKQVRVTVAVTSPPMIGKDPVKSENGQTALDAVFVIRSSQEGRFVTALRSRGLGSLLSITDHQNVRIKLSIAMEPANLELDSSGKLVKELSQSERIENVAQFYKTDTFSSDDISSSNPEDDRPVGFLLLAPTGSGPSTVPRSTIVPNLVLVPQSDSRAKAPPVPATPSSPLAVKSQTSLIRSGASRSQATARPLTSLRRTGSQAVREAVFGTSDEELSEISEDDSPSQRSKARQRNLKAANSLFNRASSKIGRPGRLIFESIPINPPVNSTTKAATAPKARASNATNDSNNVMATKSLSKDTTTVVARASSVKAEPGAGGRSKRGRLGRVVLDSDEESPVPQPVHDTFDFVHSEDNQASGVTPSRQHISQPTIISSGAPAPATPPVQHVSAAVQGSGTTKVLRFSDKLASRSGASALQSPAVAATSTALVTASKSALKPARTPASVQTPMVKLDSLDDIESSPPKAPGPPTRPKRPPAAPRVDVMAEFSAGLTSSPAALPIKKGVLASLRKKHQPLEPVQPERTPKAEPHAPAAAKPAKRKASEPPGKDSSNRPVKRARPSDDAKDVKPDISDRPSEPPGFKPRTTTAARATKRYRAKKLRTSSPDIDLSSSPAPAASKPVKGATKHGKVQEKENVIIIDYDELPGAPPAPKAKQQRAPSPAPAAKKGVTKVKTEAKKGVDVKKTVEVKSEPAARNPAGLATAARKGKDAAKRDKKKTEASGIVRAASPEPPQQTQLKKERPKPRSVAAKKTNAVAPKEPSPVPALADSRFSRPDPMAESAMAVETEEDVSHGFSFDMEDSTMVDIPIEDIPSPRKNAQEKTMDLVPPSSAYKVPGTSNKSNKTPWDTFSSPPAVQLPSSEGFGVSDEKDVSGEGVRRDQERITNEPVPSSSDPPAPPMDRKAAVKSLLDDEPQVETTLPPAAPPTQPKPLSKHSGTLKKVAAPGSNSAARATATKLPAKEPPIVVKKGNAAVTIDLTVDSPPKRAPTKSSMNTTGRALSPIHKTTEELLPVPSSERENDEGFDATAAEQQQRTPQIVKLDDRRRVTASATRIVGTTPVPAIEVKARLPTPRERSRTPALVKSSKQVIVAREPQPPPPRRKEEYLPVRVAEAGGRRGETGDATMDKIVDVLETLHQVIVDKITGRFEAVREEVRIGRDELLRDAAEDLYNLRDDHIVHFNQLVELEAQYATVGRNLVRGSEDMFKINQELCRDFARAVADHDRNMLSKKMPVTLIALGD